MLIHFFQVSTTLDGSFQLASFPRSCDPSFWGPGGHPAEVDGLCETREVGAGPYVWRRNGGYASLVKRHRPN